MTNNPVHVNCLQICVINVYVCKKLTTLIIFIGEFYNMYIFFPLSIFRIFQGYFSSNHTNLPIYWSIQKLNTRVLNNFMYLSYLLKKYFGYLPVMFIYSKTWVFNYVHLNQI